MFETKFSQAPVKSTYASDAVFNTDMKLTLNDALIILVMGPSGNNPISLLKLSQEVHFLQFLY